MQKKTEAETHLKEYQFNIKDFLQYQEVLYLFKDYALLTEMMKRNHNNFYAEHFEYEKTFKIIQRKVFWPVMHSDIQQYVKKCKICQKIRISKQRPYRLLMTLL